MSCIIIYHSECGHTKRYAEYLNMRIAADKLISLDQFKFKDILNYDNIIYAGNIKNNVIVGLNKLLKKYKKIKDKNIFVIGVGLLNITAMNNGNDTFNRDIIIISNSLDDKHVRLYLLPGGFNINKFSKFKGKIIKRMLKFASKDKSGGEKASIDMLLNNGIDLVDINNLDKIVSVYNRVNNK